MKFFAMLFCALPLFAGGCDDGASRTDRDLAGSIENSVHRADSLEGTLEGRVLHSGETIEFDPLAITSNVDVCGLSAPNSIASLLKGGGVADAVVYLEDDGRSTDTQMVSIDQIGCQYYPHVVAAMVGSTMRFTNSDPAAHNVRIEEISSGRIVLNVAQPAKGATNEWIIPREGSYLVACDYHPWMNAYIVGVPTRKFAVTDSSGHFRITGISGGQRSLTLWHSSITVREKRDTDGRLIGYRFGEPVVMRDMPILIEPKTTTSHQIAIDLKEQSVAAQANAPQSK